jgi:antitoxin (DNA-binding transcriptional repressor) of toxin-antitoxin stability system
MSETRIDISEVQKRFPELLQLASTGNEIIVTQDDEPRAKLVAIAKGQRRVAGLHPDAIQPADDFKDALPESFWAGQ